MVSGPAASVVFYVGCSFLKKQKGYKSKENGTSRSNLYNSCNNASKCTSFITEIYEANTNVNQ